jgi:hypothetical protein
MKLAGVSRSVRICRWGSLIAVAAALSGCNPRPFGDPPPTDPQPSGAAGATGAGGHGRDGGAGVAGSAGVVVEPLPPRTSHYLASNRNVDLLFLIDDSSSMRLSQENLMRNFPVLMNTLQNLPGGMPNVHIGVISSDMGAGDGNIAGCDTSGGKNGILQYTARGSCTSTGLAAGAAYISDIGGVRNYTGNLADVFTCIAAIGESGCGFEHQFAAVTRALGADGRGPAPAENQGFLRPDAYLAIVMITNEDDCSATLGVPLYDTGSNTNIASQLGPPANFRCNEFGHLCDEGTGNLVHPSRNAPNADVSASVSYPSCRSNDGEGYLLSVRGTANRIKALKADDGQVMVAAITGAPSPYVVGWKAPSVDDTSCGAASCPWPVIQHACTAADGSFADPAVRINELVSHFGANGTTLSICAADYSPALANIAGQIVEYVTAPCIQGRIAKRPGTTREDCTVTDNTTGASVPACADTNNSGTCWSLVAGANACGGGVSVSVQGTTLDTTVDCTMCVPGVPDPARGCP